jgi:hypothetical protein
MTVGARSSERRLTLCLPTKIQLHAYTPGDYDTGALSLRAPVNIRSIDIYVLSLLNTLTASQWFHLLSVQLSGDLPHEERHRFQLCGVAHFITRATQGIQPFDFQHLAGEHNNSSMAGDRTMWGCCALRG